MQLLGTFRKEQRRKPPQPFIRKVNTQEIQYRPLRPAIFSMGRVMPLERLQLTPEVSGLVLENGFRLRKSESFRKGEILMRIDTSQIHPSYSATISDLQNALAGMLPELSTDHPEAVEPWKHFFSLCSVDTLPPLPVPKSDREKLLATRYSVYKLYYQALQQRNTLEKHTIRAPFTGTVEQTQVYPFSMARAGTPVATIVRTDAVEIEIALTQDQLRFINNKTAVTVKAESLDEPLQGMIHRIGNILDERMQTASVFVRIEGSAAAKCRSGAYAAVSISGREIEHAVAVPRKALHDGYKVYIIESDTLAERKVEVAYMSVDAAYLTGGIEESALLITDPLQDAVIGMKVESFTAGGIKSRIRKEADQPGSAQKTERRKNFTVSPHEGKSEADKSYREKETSLQRNPQ